MKKRTLIIYTVIILMGCIFAVMSGYSQEDVITVADSAFEKKMRPAVPFLHDTHNETAEIDDCNTCHHIYENGKIVEYDSSEDQECSGCHTLNKGDNPMSLINIYHLQCKGCHQEKKAGPIMCSECHPK
jgi:Class III cytochrome C family